VYVTLGAVFNEDNPVLGVAIAAVRELDVNVIATSGPGTDPRRFGPAAAHGDRAVPATSARTPGLRV